MSISTSVVGYQGFKSYGDKAYSRYKPGQNSLIRDYYSKATTEVPSGEKCLENYGRFGSDYGAKVSAAVKPGDYKVPSKDANGLIHYDLGHKPELFNHTRRAQFEGTKDTLAEAGAKTLAGTTSHWKSNYVATNDDQFSKDVTKSQRPVWSIPRQAYSSKRCYFSTEYQSSLGTYGHNPMNRIPQESSKLTNELTDLTVGTTKTTTHIPGYNGFIPKTDFNPLAVKQASTLNARNTIVKQNMIENYSVKLPGYAGHKPMNGMNEKGQIRPNCLATTGEIFK